jgi:signal peptidase
VTTLEYVSAARAGTDARAEASPGRTVATDVGAKSDQRRGELWRAIWTGVSAGILAIIIGLALVIVVIPHVARATPLTVLTGSMRPHLPPGTLLVVRPVKAADVRIGDVITYEPNPDDATTVISHRVIAITSTSDGAPVFTVQGDANSAADAPVMSKQVVAKLWYSVPLLGWVNSWLSGARRTWAVPVVAVLLLIYAVWNITAGAVDRARKRRRGAARGRRRAEPGDVCRAARGAGVR